MDSDPLDSPFGDPEKYRKSNERMRDSLLRWHIATPSEKMSYSDRLAVIQGIGAEIYYGKTLADLVNRRVAAGCPPDKAFLPEEEEAYRWHAMTPEERSPKRQAVSEILSRKEWPPEWMIIEANNEDSYNRFMERCIGMYAGVMSVR